MDKAIARSRVHRWKQWLPAWVLLGLLLTLWLIVTTWRLVPPFVLPPPQAVGQRLAEGVASGLLPRMAATTLAEAGLGCVGAVVLGVPLAYAVFRWRMVDRALSPYIAASQAIPAIALAPLLVLWVGYGLAPIVVLTTLMVFFPVFVATLHALRSVDRDVLDAARLDGAGPRQLLRYIYAPMALPGFLAGLRAGLPLSITGAVVGEFVMGGQGLGLLLSVQRENANTAGLFATISVLGALAALIYLLVAQVERRSRTVRALRSWEVM
ncbi:ABC transporter permease [Buchananella hordeovulneris]|uniref:ABC transporter permease n=1 Tax=Buchananella hordeovulneris TaxID=52770 RepID=UPI0024820ADA|nr:ABC transporter permease [Buchananella hordeovulneris]MDO5079671.1 ABC transporter permease [Buchananella hordeovulneris]